MKSLIALALTVVGLNAHAFSDHVKCTVTACDNSHSTSNSCTYIKAWDFRIGNDVAIWFEQNDGITAEYATHGTTTSCDQGLTVYMQDTMTKIEAMIPWTCIDSGTYNQNCVVNSNIDGQMIVNEGVNKSEMTKYTYRCQAVN